jgi:hypothetical protein
MKVPFIISYEKKNDKIRDFTILLSAFGYENEAAGTYIRFFWLPLKIGDGTGENDVADADVDKNIFFAGDEYNPYFGFNYNHSSLSDTGLSDKAFVKRNIF